MTEKRKRGRPKLDKPPQIKQRPKAIADSVQLPPVRLTPQQMAVLDDLVRDTPLPSRSAALRWILDRWAE
jgi:hypothetical protein